MTQTTQPPRPFARLVEESASEAGYLWTRLDAALDAHDYSLREVHVWVEERLRGALDGVQLAGREAIEPWLLPALQDCDAGAVSAAAFMLASMDDIVAVRALERALHQAEEEAVPALARGLGRTARVEFLHALWSRLSDAEPLARAVVLEALTFCGEAPDADLLTLLRHEARPLRLAAASALRFAPARSLPGLLDHAFVAPDLDVRNRALCSGVAAGDGHAWQRCRALASSLDGACGPLLPLLAMLGTEPEQRVLERTLARPELARDALWALGFAGTVFAADLCIAHMSAGQHAQVAAESFCAITGLDLAQQGLIAPARDDEVPSFEDDDLDAPLECEADSELPVPDIEGVAAWWRQHRSELAPGTRHLSGRVASVTRLREALETGPTRRRHALAVELSARSCGAFVLETFAFTDRQRTQLRQLAALSDSALRAGSRTLGIAPLASA
jgi:uncharacterized protein (TIGR02270 family)